MEFQLRQKLRLTQQLIMTPQLQMAIKLLQLNRMELVDRIRQELEENPALEEKSGKTRGMNNDSNLKPPARDNLKHETSFNFYLSSQTLRHSHIYRLSCPWHQKG